MFFTSTFAPSSDARDPDALADAVHLDLQPAVAGERQVVLRYLVALHQVGVGVVLAVELGVLRDLAVEGQRGHDGVLDGLLVDGGQDTGHAQADGTDVGVGGGGGVVGAAATEHLAAGGELRVHLHADDGLVLGGDGNGH
jgi:hypothetical protein